MKRNVIQKMMLLFALLMIGKTSMAQTYSISGIKNYKIRNSGEIMDKNVLKGYYLFYESEKVDKQNRNFIIVVLDENLKEKTLKTVTESKYTYMLEAAYNGDVILFKFYNGKDRTINYVSLYPNGEFGEKNMRLANSWEIGEYDNVLTKDLENFNLNTFGNNFVDVIAYKESKGVNYQIQCVDKNGKGIWQYTAPHNTGLDRATFLAANQKYMVLMIERAKNLYTRDIDFGVLVLDSLGNVVFQNSLAVDEYNMMPHNAFFDEKNGNIILIGEYFDAKIKSMKAESLGIFTKTLDITGKELAETVINWDNDVATKVDKKYKSELSNHSVYFHQIVPTSDGKILAIGELYRKQVSALGVLNNLNYGSANTDVSNLEIKIGNIVIIELSADFQLSNVKVIEKRPNRVNLSKDYQYMNQHLLAKNLRSNGYFDYSFTQNNADNSSLSICFTDAERVSGKLNRQIVVNMVKYSVGASENYQQKKWPIQTDAFHFTINPAKLGNIMKTEWRRSNKTLTYTLIPVE